MLKVRGVFDIKGRGPVAVFVDNACEPGEHERINIGSRLRRADGAEWEARGAETMGYRRAGGYLLHGPIRPVVGDELELLPDAPKTYDTVRIELNGKPLQEAD